MIFMKKLLSLIILSAIALTALSSCASLGYYSEDELYELGTEVVGTMKKLIKSDEYGEIFGVASVLETAKTVDLSDYDDPEAVYAVTLPSIDELYEAIGASDEDWDDLSDTVKEQLEARLGFSNIATMLNNRMGTSAIAASSIYIAMVKDENLRLEEPVTYVYVYESVAVAVTFGKYETAQGQLIFVEDTDDVEDMLEDFGCDVTELDVK